MIFCKGSHNLIRDVLPKRRNQHQFDILQRITIVCTIGMRLSTLLHQRVPLLKMAQRFLQRRMREKENAEISSGILVGIESFPRIVFRLKPRRSASEDSIDTLANVAHKLLQRREIEAKNHIMRINFRSQSGIYKILLFLYNYNYIITMFFF
jgi:hypothetical protein